jgi:protein ImuB
MLWSCILLPQLAPEGQREAIEALCLWALQWSSAVSARACGEEADDPLPALWLELGASQRLFGTPEAMRTQLGEGLAELGHEARIGVAPTPRAAALFAHAGIDECVPDLATLRARLAPLPIRLLALPAQQLAALRSTGLQRIGELLALPDAALARRIGPAPVHYLQRLMGRLPEPLRLYEAPPAFASRCELPGPVGDTTALLFPLQRLLAALQGYLRGLDRAVQRCTLRLEHHRRPDTRVEIGLARPGREAAQLLTLARERFASLVLPAPVLGIVLEAPELLQPLVLQLDGFSNAAQQAGQLQQLIDRLAARLGAASVQRLQLRDAHRPELAWGTQPAQLVATGFSSLPDTRFGKARCRELPPPLRDAADVAPPGPPRPCWLLPEPRAIRAPARLLAGPERIESGWWDGDDVARDYYLACDSDGARLWVYRDLRGGQWHLHGYWA